MADGSSASAKAGEIVAKLRDAAQKVLTKNSDTGNYVILDEAKEKYQVLAARSSNLSRDVRDQYQALALRGSTLSRDVLGKTGITPEDLSKVHRVPAFVALAAIFINLLLIFSRYNTGWVKGFMKINGKVYEAYVSLMAVELGEGGADTWRFHEEMGVDCGTSDSEYCMLSSLCEASLPEGADPSAYTPTEAWCALEEAGKLAQTLLWLGFIPGIGTMFLTLLFAAKEIGKVGTYLSKAEKQGISMTIQKYAISACWVGLWAFLFISMVAYAAEVPDGLGVGLISLEASFGVVRLSFLLVSIFGSLLIVSLFDMWRADGFIEAWMEFAETPLCSVKKALYLELMLQMCCYLLMFIDKVQVCRCSTRGLLREQLELRDGRVSRYIRLMTLWRLTLPPPTVGVAAGCHLRILRRR